MSLTDSSLTVLTVAYPFVPIGPDAVGGTEQVATAMDRAVSEAGHRSVVVASAGSDVTGRLFAVPPCPPCLTDELIDQHHAYMREAIAAALSEERVDVIHMHGIDFADYLPPPGPPLLATYHLPIPWYPKHAIHLDRGRSWLQCVSARQQRDIWPNPLLLPFIPNGVDLQSFARPREPSGEPGGYALMLTRICVEKGIHDAIDSTAAAGVKLVIAGEVSAHEAHQEYFEQEIAPRLGPNACFIGPAGVERKAQLLAGARCLMVPSTAEETSSLVAMEAAAAGVPVIAYGCGALPEIIENNRTGILVDTFDQMVDAVRRIGDIDSDTCRAVARARFDLRHMTTRTIDRYRALASWG